MKTRIEMIQTNPNRLLFFDMVRDLAMVSVVIYHAVGAYATVAPYWAVHDGVSMVADGIRLVFDVFMMPVFFFVAGYFALTSYQRKGAWIFLKGKFRQLGFPWALGILVVIPIVLHQGAEKASTTQTPVPFWEFWFDYLQRLGHVQIGPRTLDNQMHFWFLSVLISFFIVFALWRVIASQKRKDESAITPPASTTAILKTLIVVSALTAVACFAVLLLVPSVSWVKVDLLLEFQPTSLVLYAAYFVLGILAYSGQWFANNQFPGRLSIWIPIGIGLTAAFLVVGRGEFSNSATPDPISPLVLFGFAGVRTFLCLAFLVTFISFSVQYGSRPSKLVQNLADHSYNIYLVHVFFVVAFQDVLILWQGGPPLVKVAIVTLAVLPISYGVSKLMKRYPHGVVGLLVGLFLLKIIGGLVLA